MDTKENILLDELEASPEFASFKDLIKETLQAQWLDLVSSGVIDEIYRELGGKTNKDPNDLAIAIALLLASKNIAKLARIEKLILSKVSARLK
jgi:hypothetical protein